VSVKILQTDKKYFSYKKGKQMRNFLLGTIILFCSSVYSFAETKMSFALDWKFEGPSAPYFYAIDQGFFKAEGMK